MRILTDESARKAYDKVLNGKKAAALRNRELDSKRRKLKEDLEYREQQAQYKKKSDYELLKVGFSICCQLYHKVKSHYYTVLPTKLQS